MNRKRSPLKPGLDSDLDLRIGLKQKKVDPRNKHKDRRRRLRSRLDLNATVLVRQTASIFRQPVSMVTNHPNNKVKTDLRRYLDLDLDLDLDQPKQLFWNRKLFGLSSLDAVEHSFQLNLPDVFHGHAPSCSDQSLLAAIAGALHSGPAPSGQLTLTGRFRVTDDDIRRQEVLVQGVRRRLEEVLMVHVAAKTEKAAAAADGSEQNHQQQVDLMPR